MNKKAYHYDAYTLIFTNETDARESPIDKGNFLLPANSTWDAPPHCKSNERARFIEGKWTKIKYFVGETWYKKEDRSPVVIEKMGAPSDDLTNDIPTDESVIWGVTGWERDVEQYISMIRSSKIDELTKFMNEENSGDCTIFISGTERKFQRDLESRSKINDALSTFSAIGDVPDGFFWVDATNNMVPFTLSDLRALALASSGWAAFQKLQLLKSKINNTRDTEMIKSLTWN